MYPKHIVIHFETQITAVDMHTVLPLSIQTLCEVYRHVASPNDIIFFIRRLHSKHLDCAHAVASKFLTMSFCIPPKTSAEKRFCLNT